MQSSNRAFVSVAVTLFLINPATRVLGQDLGFSPMPMGESINSAKLIPNRVQRVTFDASRLARVASIFPGCNSEGKSWYESWF